MKISPTLERPEPIHTDERPRIQLSATQIIASAMAAITATVAASFLGVAGTVIGAALASVLTVTGNAVYSTSIRRTGARVRTAVPSVVRFAPRATAATPVPDPTVRPVSSRHGWRVAAAACVGVFAGVLFVITAVELVAGRPISDVVRGDSGSGTTVLGNVDHHTDSGKSSPAPRATVTVTPTVVTSTPTITVTGSPATKTVTPTTTTTATPGPTSTPTPTTSPPSPSTSADASGAAAAG